MQTIQKGYRGLGLLFELNRGWFLQAIQSRLRRAGGRIDAQDVLQEVWVLLSAELEKGTEPPPTPGLRREGSRRDEKGNP